MKMFGFGLPGQGFHCLEIPGHTKKSSNDNVGLIKIRSGEASSKKLEEELKHLIDAKWNWHVRQLSDLEYLTTFPNKLILDTFSRSKGIDMALHNISAMVTHSNLSPTASAVLQMGCVLLSNVPDPARNVEAVTFIAELAGEVIVVDEVSLIKEGAVIVKLQARDISKLRGFLEVFILGVGYEIKITPKASKRGGFSPPPQDTDEESWQHTSCNKTKAASSNAPSHT
jgi:hypothetical protein